MTLKLSPREIQALVLLIIAGWVGNALYFPLFFGVDLLFGSIAIWLVMFLFGWSWGMLAALVASVPTVLRWGHPYGLILFTAEALFVGYLWRWQKRNLVLLDSLYWLLLGVPLMGVFYGGVMGLDTTQVALLMLKGAVNGILNAFIASLLMAYLPLRQWIGKPQPLPSLPLQQTLFNLLLAFALLPVMLLMMFKGQWAFQEMENRVNASLTSVSSKLVTEVRQVQQERLAALEKLAQVAQKSQWQASEELQQATEWLQQLFPAMQQVYVSNSQGRLIAADPALSSKAAICSTETTSRLAPSLSSKVDRLQMNVAILNRDRIQGCVVGEVDLQDLRQRLQSSQNQPQWQISLLDGQGQMLASTHPLGNPLLNTNEFVPSASIDGITHWLPKANQRLPLERWQGSVYRQKRSLGENLPWTLVLEVPAAPYILSLQRLYLVDLLTMLLIALLALLLSQFLSRRLVNSLSRLASVTTDLPDKLLQHVDIPWRQSAIAEIDSLVRNFQLMAATLQEKFRELQTVNETLEILVGERTQELSQANQELAAEITEKDRTEVALRESEGRFRLMAEVTLKIRQSLEIAEILQTTVTEVQRFLEADRIIIFQLWEDNSGTVVQEAVVPGFPAILGRNLVDPCFHEGYLELYRQGRISAINDLETEKIQPCHRQFLSQFAVKANLVVPILIRNQLWGLLIAHQCAHPRHWNEFEVELSLQLADQIGIAISQAQLLEHLEELVAERTLKLTTTNQKLQQEVKDRWQAEESLRHSEEQLRLITDALPVLISYVDAQQVYRFTNRAYEDWFGQPRSAINGHSLEAVLGKSLYQEIRGYVETALSGESVTFEQEIPKNGIPHWVSATYVSHGDAKGEVKGFFAVISDISDRKAMERMKDEFISIVSHELRTPLTSIHGSLKLLATGRLGHLYPEGEQMLEIADENTDRLVRLVNDVLDLQSMESGLVSLDSEICDAGNLIRQASEAMQGLAQQHSIILKYSLVSLSVYANSDYILQTLTNLISNAIKFSSAGDTVYLTASADDDPAFPPMADPSLSNAVLFQVQDQGRGIPPDKLESIFGRFQQIDASDSRQKGGTGLGLAICQQIIERHGGKIWAESTLGKGSIFYFTLPRAILDFLQKWGKG